MSRTSGKSWDHHIPKRWFQVATWDTSAVCVETLQRRECFPDMPCRLLRVSTSLIRMDPEQVWFLSSAFRWFSHYDFCHRLLSSVDHWVQDVVLMLLQAEKLIGRAVKELEQQLDSSHLLTLLAVPWPSSHFSSYFNGWFSTSVVVLKVLCRLLTSLEISGALARSFLTSHRILTRILFRSFSSSHRRFLYPSDSRWIIWAASSRHKVDSRKLKSSSNVRCEASLMWNLQFTRCSHGMSYGISI